MLIKVLLIASALLVVNTIIHALAMTIAIRWSRHIAGLHPAHPFLPTARPMVVSAVVLLMFFASVVEVMTWAQVYQFLGAFKEAEPALYFSMVTYTTLGYGDIVLEGSLRLLSSFQMAIGIIMFGWTTAVVLAVVQRVYQKPQE
ncbi:potassium channel family protein [Microbulbifer pacificus]|uniref:Potassium channel family protein n=1 Tax=Microbulbifer pacificus TaxID=407164 RepID=A0AAU0MY24_9GAMM|nr:potassium channel family protein [Microbulbifer pacificus]WOX05515.1 potassium channel family protein [Microbulbifer pacificus]